jgi:hypothetical protein
VRDPNDHYFGFFEINTGPATVALDLDAASDTGAFDDDELTGDATPTFTVTVNKIGRIQIDFDGNGTFAHAAGGGEYRRLALVHV